METKALIQSKQFWLAVAQFVIGFLALVTASFGEYIPASILGVIAMLKSFVDIWLRMQTSQPIGGIIKAR